MSSLPPAIVLLALFVLNCSQSRRGATPALELGFDQPVKVEVRGYPGNIMEPFISRNGAELLFNNLNGPPENTNLHWAVKINDSVFLYKGEITGVNTADLEGVPTLDSAGNLYFVSTRNYPATLSTLYQARYLNGAASDIQLVPQLSRMQAGWVNFDIEVSADGMNLYFVDARLDRQGHPLSADLVMAEKSGLGFGRSPHSNEILANVNTPALEYAACISTDQLELYFTRVLLPLTDNSTPEIFVSTRKTTQDPFTLPKKIAAITGFAEAPTIGPDQRTLYYHKRENGRFSLYMIRKK